MKKKSIGIRRKISEIRKKYIIVENTQNYFLIIISMKTKSTKLTQDEQDVLDELEKWNYIDVKDFEVEKNHLIKASKNTLKRKAISIRLYESDINKLKSVALSEGIPYQILISSILHKSVNKKLSFMN